MKSMLFLFTVLVATACKDGNPAPVLPDASHDVDAPGADANVCLKETGSPPYCFDLATCEPATNEDVLNGCTDASCIAFDNVARLPLYNNGTLPPLP